VGLDTAHPERPGQTGEERHGGLGLDHAREERAGDHGAEPLDGERPVHREEERTVGGTALHRRRRSPQGRAERVQPLASAGRDRDHLGLLQHAPREQGGQVRVEQGPPVVPQSGEEVALGEGDDSRPDSEELADVEVLAGLRHDPLVRRDHQDGEVDAARAGRHRLHEPLVSGDVHHPGHRAVGKREVGEAELERDSSTLLLGKPVGVDAGESLDQRRLAVVDVPGGADDHARDRARGDVGAGSGARSKRPSSATGP
jgi:hypothetical protein